MTKILEFPMEPHNFLYALSEEVGMLYYRVVQMYYGVLTPRRVKGLSDSRLERECLEVVRSRLIKRLGE